MKIGSRNRWPAWATVMGAAILLLTCVPAALAMWTFAWQDRSNTPFNANGVAGDVGYLSDGARGAGSTASGTYGFQVSGNTCEGNDNQDHTNTLYVEHEWKQGEDADNLSWAVTGVMTMTEKRSQQVTEEWDCVEGPPQWTASGSVVAQKPAIGSEGSGIQGGSLAQSFVHNTTPMTTWFLSHDQDPQPPGYANEHSAIDTHEWTVDPNDAATHKKRVTVKVVSQLQGAGVEIKVPVCYLKCKVQLESQATPAP